MQHVLGRMLSFQVLEVVNSYTYIDHCFIFNGQGLLLLKTGAYIDVHFIFKDQEFLLLKAEF